MGRVLALLFACAVAAAPTVPGVAAPEQEAGGRSAPAVAVRTGSHADFGRVVLDLPAGVKPEIATDGDRVLVRLVAAGIPPRIAGIGRAPRNVRDIAAAGERLTVTMAPGARLRTARLGSRLLLDIVDASVAAASPQGGKPASRPRALAARAAASPPPPPPVPPPAPPASVGRAAALDTVAAFLADLPPPAAPVATGGPIARAAGGIAATRGQEAGAAPAPAVPTVTLPFGPLTGAAAFRRGELALLVFDERRPLDLAPLRRDPAFGEAAAIMQPEGTLVRLPVAPGMGVRLERAEEGWRVSLVAEGDGGAALRPIRPQAEAGRLRLDAEMPGRVMAVADPLTGGTLLVGTQRAAGQAVPVDRRSPEFALLPTWQGVALVPLSDSVRLEAGAAGFAVSAAPDRELALSPAEVQAGAVAEAARASRLFDLPPLERNALHRRLQRATASAAGAAPQARAGRRREVAEALLALGMGAEMQSVVAVAQGEDAAAGGQRELTALAAVAALLADRPGEAEGIDDPRLTGTDEIALWRAVRQAMREEGDPAAAAVFASSMPLLLSYPEPLRDRLLPLALETMALGGEVAAARATLARFADLQALDLARGLAAARAAGGAAEALALFDRVAATPDRRARARAARQAIELRLAGGELTPAQAADALERRLYAWRGDEREVAARVRLAELRADAGAWRQGLAMLRETIGMFPDEAPRLRPRLAAMLERSLAPEAQAAVSPLDLIALAEENADLIPGGSAGHGLAARLAERLAELDLPERAGEVLARLVADVAPGAARAAFGARLAALRLQHGDAAGALAALGASAAEGALPTPLLEDRTLTFARASAALGDRRGAVAALRDLGTHAATLLRAGLLEEAKDWPGTAAALAEYVAATVPAAGPHDSVQAQLILRLASAAAQAGDEGLLARLRELHTERFPEGRVRDLFQLITATPVRVVADLPRAASEMRLARGMPESLRAMSLQQ